jgi:hypothetical protein|nr:MAG TPA: hypothetical protein [Caudoviricetes sp.]
MTKLYECRGADRTLLTTNRQWSRLDCWQEVVEHDVEPTIRLLTDKDDLDALSDAVGTGYDFVEEDTPFVLAWLAKERPKAASALAMDRCDYHDMMARLWYGVHVDSKESK